MVDRISLSLVKSKNDDIARSSNEGACVNARGYLRQRRQRHSVGNARVIT